MKKGEPGHVFKNGKKIADCKYDKVGYTSEGFTDVKLNGKYGYVDSLFKEVVPVKYDFAGGFSEGAACVELNKKYGLIDKTGKEVFPLIAEFSLSIKGGLTHAIVNGKIGYIDKKGQTYWGDEAIDILFVRLGGKIAMETYVKVFMKKLSESNDRYLFDVYNKIKAANTDSMTKKISNALCTVTGGACPKEIPVKKISLTARHWDMAKNLFLITIGGYALPENAYKDMSAILDKAKDDYFIIEEGTRQRIRN